MMRTPPFLLGAALVFWGWQTGFLIPGAVMAVVLEAAKWVRARWEFSDEDFGRMILFCGVLFLAAAVYSFTSNGGPAHFSQLLENPNPSNQSGAGAASALTAISLFRWMPMLFFLPVAAQAYSSREEIPFRVVRQVFRRSPKSPEPATPRRAGVNLAFPFFALCLYAASNHESGSNSYFLGFCVLLGWALWSVRNRRFNVVIWLTTLVVCVGIGYGGQRGLIRFQSLLGNLDSQLLARILGRGNDGSKNKTALGQLGRIKLSGKIVIRVEPKSGSVPTYLREATYRLYKAQTWYSGNVKESPDIVPETPQNSGNYNLVPERTNTSSARIACYLESRSAKTGNASDLLPVPEGCGRLENFHAYLLEKYSTGTLLADGPGLVTFDALFGPGRRVDSPPGTNEDLSVPPKERDALDQVISEMHLRRQTTDETLHAVNEMFQTRFRYSLWQEPPKLVETNDTPLGRFLLLTQSGHCEYFATATVLLLRELGIRARYNVGYVVHEKARHGYVVRLRDAHAWCLVWNDQKQEWQDFDTTPPSWMAEEAKQASGLEALGDAWSWLGFQFAKFRWGQSQWRSYFLMALVPVLALLMFQIVFRRKGRRKRSGDKRREVPVSWPGLDSEFYRVESLLIRRGVRRRPDEPLGQWLNRALREPLPAELKVQLRELLQLHYRCRFDPVGLSTTERDRLKRDAGAALTHLQQCTTS